MKPTLRQQFLGLRILHAGLAAPLAIYGVIAFGVLPRRPHAIDPTLVLAIAAGVAVLLLVAVIPFLRRVLMPPRQTAGETVELDAPMDPHVAPAINKLRVASILTWTCAESIAMFGLIVTVLTGEPLYYVPFAGAALVAFAVFTPTVAMFESVIRAARG